MSAEWPELEYEIDIVVRRYDDGGGLMADDPIELHIYDNKVAVMPESNLFDILDNLKMNIDDAIRRDMTEYQLTKDESLYDEEDYQSDRVKQEYYRRKYNKATD